MPSQPRVSHVNKRPCSSPIRERYRGPGSFRQRQESTREESQNECLPRHGKILMWTHKMGTLTREAIETVHFVLGGPNSCYNFVI